MSYLVYFKDIVLFLLKAPYLVNRWLSLGWLA